MLLHASDENCETFSLGVELVSDDQLEMPGKSFIDLDVNLVLVFVKSLAIYYETVSIL